MRTEENILFTDGTIAQQLQIYGSDSNLPKGVHLEPSKENCLVNALLEKLPGWFVRVYQDDWVVREPGKLPKVLTSFGFEKYKRYKNKIASWEPEDPIYRDGLIKRAIDDRDRHVWKLINSKDK